MDELEFDAEIAAKLERAYRARDAERRRELVLEALDARPGERVLDVGCGPGLYVAELADAVGEEGHVTGVDPSDAMLALARQRCDGRANVSLERGAATALPLPDASVDAALSVQVLEYVTDVDVALRELQRVLRPGGRLVVWDVDWETVSMRADDDLRHARVLDAWDRHLVHTSLPATLVPLLRLAGFEDVRLEGYAFATSELTPDAYGGMVLSILETFVSALPDFPSEDAAAWAAEQRALGERGEFYFACVQCRVTARRP